MLVIIFALTLTVAYYFLCFRPSRKHLYKLADSIPTGGHLPIIGHSHWFIGGPEKLLKNIAALAGKIEGRGGTGAIWLGPTLYVFILNPEDAQKVLEISLDKDESYKFIRAWLGNGLFVAPYDIWKNHRRALLPMFHKVNVQNYKGVFNVQSSVLVKRLALKVGEPEFDIFKFITACTLDIIFEAAMGERMDLQHNPDTPYVLARKMVMSIINMRLFKPWLQPDPIFNLTPYSKQQKEGIDITHEFSKEVIFKKRELEKIGKQKTDGVRDFLDMLMAREEKFSDLQLSEHVDAITIAGNDTTALAISYTLVLLGQHQDIQEKVYNEIISVMGDSDRETTKEDLKKLRYMEMVINEAMRLYTVTPVIGRRTTSELKLSDCTVPPGVSIAIGPYFIHRSKKIWGPTADEFDPDRFLPENSVDRHPCAFMPFSHGQRDCIGRHFAWVTMKSILVYALREYKFKSKLAERFKIEMLLFPINGHLLTVEKRRN